MSAKVNAVAIFSGRPELAGYLRDQIQESDERFTVRLNPRKVFAQDLVVIEVPAITSDTAELLAYLDEQQPRELVIFSPPEVLSQPETVRLIHGRRRPAYLMPYDAPTLRARSELARLVLGILSDAPSEVIISARLESARRLKVTTADLRFYRVHLGSLEIPDAAALRDEDIEVDETLYAITVRDELSVPLHTIRYHGDEKYRQQQDELARREQDNLGNRVRQLRERRGLRQEDLALATGITRKQLSLIENGEAMPRASTLDQLARALGLTVEELLRGLEMALHA